MATAHDANVYVVIAATIGGGVFGYGIDHGVYPHARTFLAGVNITF